MAMMKAMYPKTRERLFDTITTVLETPDEARGNELAQPAIDIIREWCSEADLIETLKVATILSKFSRS